MFPEKRKRSQKPTTHFINLRLIHLLPAPLVPLDLLRVHLPLGEEADDVSRVIDGTVGAEFGFDVLVAEQSHFAREMFAVRAEQATVEGNGR